MLKQQGFTLLELLITLAIVAILLGIGAPSFVSLIDNNRATLASNRMLSMLTYARSEAIKTQGRVAVCSSDNATATVPACAANWSGSALVVFNDADADNNIGADTNVLRIWQRPPNLTLTSGSTTVISYGGNGFLASGAQTFTLAFGNNSTLNKQLVISMTGRPRIE